jgi:thymidylate synthase (FAD)
MSYHLTSCWQELSRRYVSGERVPFEFYISEKMKGLESEHEDYYMDGMSDFETDFINTHSTEELLEMCLEHYRQALEQGVKPQEARRIIPQCAYTQIWGAFMPKQLDNYFKLRLDESSQWEIRQTAIAMQELIKG